MVSKAELRSSETKMVDLPRSADCLMLLRMNSIGQFLLSSPGGLPTGVG